MFTSRGDAGDSVSPYAAFNLCHYTGDSKEHVAECRGRLAAWLGIPADNIIVPRQTHSTQVRFIGSLPVDPESVEGVDALVTTLKGVAVGVSTADCVPVVLVDEEAGVAGVAHAGWRGALGGIAVRLVEEMLRRGADIDRLRAFFGPAICCSCFEVGEEVAVRFPDEYVVRKPEWKKPHVDLPAFVAGQLRDAGLSPCRIAAFTPELCTACHPDRYFSARKSGVESGRNFTFVVLGRADAARNAYLE